MELKNRSSGILQGAVFLFFYLKPFSNQLELFLPLKVFYQQRDFSCKARVTASQLISHQVLFLSGLP
jgi:hypothetical protein